MFSKERLLKISELNGEKIKLMEDSHLDTFIANVHSLIDGFPALEESIKNALKTNDRSAMTVALANVSDMLLQIHADKLAGICKNHLGIAQEAAQKNLQTFVINLLKAVSSLSIDLQMIEYQTEGVSSDVIQEPECKNSILAVDDTHFFLQMIKTMLKDTDYKVTCVNSGESALNYLRKHRPALFILDIDMPGMNGYELAREIRKSGHSAPIIFLTGNAKKDYVIKALQVGAADFIVKPVKADQLLERIGKYIKPEPKE